MVVIKSIRWPLRGLFRALPAAAAVCALALALAGPATAGSAPTLVAAGDIACSPAENAAASTPGICQQGATAAVVRSIAPQAVAALGDEQYERGSLADFQGSFELSWGTFKRLIRPAPGNHEYDTALAAGYFDYFDGVGNQTGAAGDRDTGYYSYDLGAWHVVVLNSNCNVVPCDGGSLQEQWLRGDLVSHRSACTVAGSRPSAMTCT